MSVNWGVPAAIVGAAILTVVGCGSQGEVPSLPETVAPVVADTGATAGVVVLELFTSQGCSSCPPADTLLAELGAERPAHLIPLAYHVDYWNYIGWTDPFSSEAWTARQGEYNRALGHDGLYTPELVVNGSVHIVGSNADGVSRAIAEALARAPSGSVSVGDVRAVGSRVRATARAEMVSDVDSKALKLFAVLFENGLRTSVRRGENGGRTLENSYVVRKFVEVGTLEAKTGAQGQGEISFDLDPTWKRENLGIAVLLQDPKTMRIHGATVVAVG